MKNLTTEQQQLANLIALRDVAFPGLFWADTEGLVMFDVWALKLTECRTYRCVFGHYLMVCEAMSVEDIIDTAEKECESIGSFDWESKRFGVDSLQWHELFGTQPRNTLNARYDYLCHLIEERME